MGGGFAVSIFHNNKNITSASMGVTTSTHNAQNRNLLI